MSETLTVRKVGNSAGVTFGKELLEALNVTVGENSTSFALPMAFS